MSSTRWLWRTVGFGALLSTIVCAGGFAYAVNQIMFPKSAGQAETGVPVGAPAGEAASQPANSRTVPGANWGEKTQIRIVALGDSLSAGTGDITGKGYVQGVREKLERQLGKPAYVYNNFAIPGFRTTDLLKDWEAKPDIARSIGEADLVLLTIGGNDLFEGGSGIFGVQSGQSGTETGQAGSLAGQTSKEGRPLTIAAGENKGNSSASGTPDIAPGEGFNPQAALDRMPEALKRLEQIFDKISKANPNARVLYVGLYQPFLDLDKDRTGAAAVQRWNTSAFELANRYPNITVVPTYDLFEIDGMRYLYIDHFHPNSQGYDRMADRIAGIFK